VTNPETDTCTVTVRGRNFVSLATGQGPISGEFAIVIQLDNPVDSPELPVVLGDFQGTIDFAPALMGHHFGTAVGTLTVRRSFVPGVPVDVTVPFTGVFRQPFALSLRGDRKKPGRGCGILQRPRLEPAGQARRAGRQLADGALRDHVRTVTTPLLAARELAMLDYLSGGRVLPAVGIGVEQERRGLLRRRILEARAHHGAPPARAAAPARLDRR
jgi:hypothetical protein